MAGESAREIARRRREKAERLHRVADAYEKGADGERQTAAALAMLPASGWFVLHDVRWPGRAFANIDHVVVGPGGVFVIDSKAWSGRVEVRDGVVRQNGRQREQAVAGAAEAALAVADVLGKDPSLVKPVLCFVGQRELQGWARDVMLTTPDNLVGMLTSRPQVLADKTVRHSLLGLQLELESAQKARGMVPRRPGTPRPVRRSTRSRHGHHMMVRLLGFTASVVALVFGVRVLITYADDVARQVVAGGGNHSTTHDDHRLGRSVTLPAATHRPPLRVTAQRVGTVHRVGALPYLYDGNRLFRVHLTIHNAGQRAWVSQPGTAYHVTDAVGVTHAGGTAIRIREGRVLADPVRVPPGGTVRGYVVFQVPADQPVTAVSVTVGPGQSRTAGWKVERQ